MGNCKMLQKGDENEGKVLNITKINVIWGRFFVDKWYNRSGSIKEYLELSCGVKWGGES